MQVFGASAAQRETLSIDSQFSFIFMNLRGSRDVNALRGGGGGEIYLIKFKNYKIKFKKEIICLYVSV